MSWQSSPDFPKPARCACAKVLLRCGFGRCKYEREIPGDEKVASMSMLAAGLGGFGGLAVRKAWGASGKEVCSTTDTSAWTMIAVFSKAICSSLSIASLVN